MVESRKKIGEADQGTSRKPTVPQTLWGENLLPPETSPNSSIRQFLKPSEGNPSLQTHERSRVAKSKVHPGAGRSLAMPSTWRCPSWYLRSSCIVACMIPDAPSFIACRSPWSLCSSAQYWRKEHIRKTTAVGWYKTFSKQTEFLEFQIAQQATPKPFNKEISMPR